MSALAETSVCVLDENGKPRFEGRVASQPEALIRCLFWKTLLPSRIAAPSGFVGDCTIRP